jgi:cobalt/nickel transport system permease protein
MHISDGILSPEVSVGAGLLAAGAVGYSLYRLNDTLADRTIPLTGMMASLIFAGQMINFPVGSGVSGHLIGGVLAAVVLGPWAGCLALTTVLLVQCFLFYDGGYSALGANVLNMGVVGSIGGYAIYASLSRALGRGPGARVAATVISAWLSVMAAAFLFCVEFRLSHGASAGFDFGNVFALMVTFHSAIGVGEALISGAVIGFVLKQRPDLIYDPHTNTGSVASMGRTLVAGCVCALAVAAFVAPFASDFPDGLEAAAEGAHFDTLAAGAGPLMLGGYEIPSPVEGWSESATWQKVSVSLAGILGTIVVLVIAVLFGRARRPTAAPTGTGHAE